ncbi:hypothetical protein M1O51_01870 [Dehalococcoidia bacterium]|nr:hypothetical protein [Dehalococcoidia bacterium]
MLTEEQELEIFEKYYRRIPRKITKVRYHSFMSYFGMLRRLGWVEPTGEEEISDNLGGEPGAVVQKKAPGKYLIEVPQPRRFYCLTEAGKQAPEEEWANPLVTLHGPAWGGVQAFRDYLRENQRRKREEGRRYYSPGQKAKV